MAAVINSEVGTPVLSYTEEMDKLRLRLNGKPYCKGVKELLPERSAWQIRNIVNGRGEDKMVLMALRIYIEAQEAQEQATASRLQQAGKELGVEAA